MYAQLKKKIDSVLARGGKLLIPYITAGYPDYNSTLKIVEILYRNGADILELGIPFSDPLADGATIQYSSQVALEGGMTLRKAFLLLNEIKRNFDIPVIFMSYYNPIYHLGLEKFAQLALRFDLDGVIVPDLPPEEADSLLKIARKTNFALIFLIAPTTPLKRVRKISALSRGFLYYVSLTGVTGAREKLASHLQKKLREIKKVAKLPICVGFGISQPWQAKKITAIAQGVIIGSAVINIIKDNYPSYHRKLANFIRKFRIVLE